MPERNIKVRLLPGKFVYRDLGFDRPDGAGRAREVVGFDTGEIEIPADEAAAYERDGLLRRVTTRSLL